MFYRIKIDFYSFKNIDSLPVLVEEANISLIYIKIVSYSNIKYTFQLLENRAIKRIGVYRFEIDFYSCKDIGSLPVLVEEAKISLIYVKILSYSNMKYSFNQ